MASTPSPDLASLLDDLPVPLAERCRPVRGGEPPGDGEFVVYWMRVAVRARENPALDVALALGRRLGKPVFVYHALSERYPYASDRHHTFILQGAVDVAADLAERGVGHVFHLERPGHRGDHLVTLARRAATVVTEEMPVAPLAGWTETLGRRAEAPLVSVDASCVVPMPLTSGAFGRAYEFRRAAEALRADRLERSWEDEPVEDTAFVPDELPFEPLDLRGDDGAGLDDRRIADLVAACAVDHGVAPVAGTRGGTRAGSARWEAFRDDGLARYHRRRNDAADRDGVSRLSPYLHYGMVSPLRVAREAAAQGSKGAEKFLDELLVWRELAWHFCCHEPRHGSLAALPEWARDSLEDHAGDPRPAIYSWETLARSATGDVLWNAAQRSLAVHGELHNNVRMTWGKRLPTWTETPRRALALLIDLNHRYALDGRDPNSYGGLLWCLGLFDRPFDPPSKVLGRVRGRSSSRHRQRLDMDAYRAFTDAPAVADPPTVLVVGAGMTALACARTLADHGLAVRVVGDGPADDGPAVEPDAPFEVGDRRFLPWAASWARDGLVELLDGSTEATGSDTDTATRRYRPSGGLEAVVRHLGEDLSVECGVRPGALAPLDASWRLAGDGVGSRAVGGLVVLAVEPERAIELLDQLAQDGREEHEEHEEHEERERSEAIDVLKRRLEDLPGGLDTESDHLWCQRSGIGLAGPWRRDGVEGAWLAGVGLAGRILGHLVARPATV